MHKLLYICLLMVVVVLPGGYTCFCQNAPEKMPDLFKDLPLDDADERSFLKPDASAAALLKSNVFVKAELSSARCYVGEPVLLKYKLYTCVQSSSEILVLPGLDHFTAYKIPLENEFPVYETMNGRQFRVYQLASWQLFPFSAGRIAVGPLKLQNALHAGGSQKVVPVTATSVSETLFLNVKELPARKDAHGYSGAVGSFTISVGWEQDSVSVGEVAHFLIRITGMGNFNDIHIPEIQWPRHVTPLNTIENMQVDFTAFPASGTKLFKIPVVIQSEGLTEVPGFDWVFYDPKANGYQRLVVKGQPITVVGNHTIDSAVHVQQQPASQLWAIFIVSATLMAFILLMLWIPARLKRKTHPSKMVILSGNPDNVSGFEELLKVSALKNNNQYVMRVKEILEVHFAETESGGKKVLNSAARDLISNCNYLLFMPGDVSNAGRNQLAKAVSHFCESYQQLVEEPTTQLN